MRFHSLSIIVTDIDWDTEGQALEDCKLPEAILVVDSHHPMSGQLEEFIGVEIFNKFGFNHNGFKCERYVDQATHPGGGYFPKNLALLPFDNWNYAHGKNPI